MGSFQDLLNRFRGVEMPQPTEPTQPSFQTISDRQLQRQMNAQAEQLKFNILNDRKRRAEELEAGIASKIDSFVPSQMPNAMGGMPTHGITQNLAPIPGTAMGNMDGMITDFGKGVEAIKEAKDKGGLMNPETRRMLEMLQGY